MNNENPNDAINPNEWTTKELVKHLYREIIEIKANQASAAKTLTYLQKDLDERKFLIAETKERQEQSHKTLQLLQKDLNDRKLIEELEETKRKRNVAIVAVISGIAASILTSIVEMIRK